MSMLSSQAGELRDRADELRMLTVGMDALYISSDTKLTVAYAMSSAASEMREAADTIEGLVNALEDVLRNAGDTVWVGKAETLVDRMVTLGIYGQEVYEGARPWEVDA